MKNIKRDMNDKQNAENQFDEVLSLLNKIERATPKPYFYTRVSSKLQARLEASSQPAWVSWLVQKQQWVAIGVILLIMLNVGIVYWSDTIQGSENSSSLQSMMEEYQIESGNTYSFLD